MEDTKGGHRQRLKECFLSGEDAGQTDECLLFEHYLYRVPLKDRPRRLLADWLPDYFSKTADRGYRLPATEAEEEAKQRGRAAGASRRIKRYIAFLQGAEAAPDGEPPTGATLAGWIRQCKRAGQFADGKLLFEQGGLKLDRLTLDRLSEEAQVEVEEDYQVCVRMLAREQLREDGAQKRRSDRQPNGNKPTASG